MAARKTIQQKQIEALTKKHLDEIGYKVRADILKYSKVRTSDLSESGNFRTEPYNLLTLTQNFYGKYNTPKGKPTPKDKDNIQDTVMKNAVRDHVPPGIKILVKDMIDLIKSPLKK